MLPCLLPSAVSANAMACTASAEGVEVACVRYGVVLGRHDVCIVYADSKQGLIQVVLRAGRVHLCGQAVPDLKLYSSVCKHIEDEDRSPTRPMLPCGTSDAVDVPSGMLLAGMHFLSPRSSVQPLHSNVLQP